MINYIFWRKNRHMGMLRHHENVDTFLVLLYGNCLPDIFIRSKVSFEVQKPFEICKGIIHLVRTQNFPHAHVCVHIRGKEILKILRTYLLNDSKPWSRCLVFETTVIASKKVWVRALFISLQEANKNTPSPQARLLCCSVDIFLHNCFCSFLVSVMHRPGSKVAFTPDLYIINLHIIS